MNFIDHATNKIKKAGYKITGPRMAVLEVLAKANTPLSAYDIEKEIPKNIPVNIVTIYRVLEVFEELKIIHRIMSTQGYKRCEFSEASGCHHFAVCKKCDQVEEFVEQNICSKKANLPKNLSFKQLEHVSEYIGLCSKCS